MNNENYIWENDRFKKDPYRVPEGYFGSFPDRLMERLHNEDKAVPEKRRLMRPWMLWVSSAAAIVVFGWVGLRNFYWKPLQEVRFQENIELFVDYYGEELHEGELAGYFEENNISLQKTSSANVNEMVQIEPDLTEEYIYESIGL